MLGLPPLNAIVGLIIYIAFFSKLLNFADVNILEQAFMDARQKSISKFIRFCYMTFTLAILMLLSGLFFRDFTPEWAFIGLTVLLLIVYMIAFGLKFSWDSYGKMAPIVKNTIDNHNRKIRNFVVFVLLLSSAIIGSYIIGINNHLITQSPESNYVIKFFMILIFAGFLNAWLNGVLGLLNYKSKSVRFYVDNEWYIIKKVLITDRLEVQSVLTGETLQFTRERFDNCKFEIV